MRFTEAKATVSGEEIRSGTKEPTTIDTSATPMKGGSVRSVPEMTIEEDEGETVNAKAGSDAATDGSCSAPPAVESDAFRIRGAASQPTDATLSSQEANATKEEKQPQGGDGAESVRLVEGNVILDYLCIVYPSAYNIVLTHPAFEDIRQRASSEALHNPVITLDPRSIEECSAEETLRSFDSLLRAADLNETFLSEERYNNWRRSSSQNETSSSWIQILRPLVQKASNPVSLSLLLVIRMEDSVMAAFDCVHGKGTAGIDRSVATVVAVKGKPNQKSEKDNSSAQGSAKAPERDARMRKSSRIPFHVAAEAVERHASRLISSTTVRAMDHMRSLMPEQLHAELNEVSVSLVLLSFSNVLQCNEVATRDSSSAGALMSWNSAVEMALRTLVDDAETGENTDKFTVEPPTLTPGETNQGGHDTVGQGNSASHVPAKKNKKKKKKKVRNIGSL